MTVERLPTLLAKLVESGSAFMGITKEDAQWVIEKPKEAIALFAEALKQRREAAKKAVETVEAALLIFVGTIQVLATEAFKVKNLFVVNTRETARVKISYVGDNFKKWFY
jgi:uncharacterized protein YoaH (UPF0181 family)